MSDNAFNPVLRSKNFAKELRLLQESLAMATRKAAEATQGNELGGAADARRAQLTDEKVQAIKRRIADIEG
jgi:hypothetical protein